MLLNFYQKKNLLDKGLKFRSMILPDKFIEQDKPESMYKFAGLDSQSIEEKIIDLLNSNIILQKQKTIINFRTELCLKDSGQAKRNLTLLRQLARL